MVVRLACDKVSYPPIR